MHGTTIHLKNLKTYIHKTYIFKVFETSRNYKDNFNRGRLNIKKQPLIFIIDINFSKIDLVYILYIHTSQSTYTIDYWKLQKRRLAFNLTNTHRRTSYYGLFVNNVQRSYTVKRKPQTLCFRMIQHLKLIHFYC